MNAVRLDHDEGSLGVGHFVNVELRTEIARNFDFRLVLNKVFKNPKTTKEPLNNFLQKHIPSSLILP
jgi:hypothetical protein